ncbi:hypothetical protein BHM03_00056604 [Ensete ventricosum]|nr:hypothetical protein BHM03_00056604 [Ensete ventricosum]
MMQWDLVESLLGDSPKESGSSLRTRREIAEKKTGGLTARLSKVARVCGIIVRVRVLIELDLEGIQLSSMRQLDPGLVELNQLTKELVNVKVKPEFKKMEGTTFAEISTGKPSVSDSWIARTIESGRRAAAFDG